MKYSKYVVLTMCMFLVSCFGIGEGSDTINSVEGEKQGGLIFHQGENFSMNIPASWDLIESSSDSLPSPNNGKIELAVTSTDTSSNFTNTLIVLSQDLTEPMTSKDYSIANNVGSRQDYLDYTKLSGEDMSFIDGEDSTIYVFEARYTKDTPQLKFIQTGYVCENNKAFFLTLAIPTSIRDTLKYEEMLKSFSCI